MKARIAIIDYGIGNVRSICNAFERAGSEPVLTSNHDLIMKADAVILPGVGAFGKGMSNLKERNLLQTVLEYVSGGRPFLGICLGMQMLMDESEEFGVTEGIGLIKGKVIRMPLVPEANHKLPHVGWNGVRSPNAGRWRNTLLHDVPENSDVYFVHSYVAVPDDEKDILTLTSYGITSFCSAVNHKNVFGTQFHPEKSGELGLTMLRKFIALI